MEIKRVPHDALESVAPSANMDAGGRGATLQPVAEGQRYFDKRLTKTLILAGYDTPDKIRVASDQELLAVDGVGRAALRRIRFALGQPT